MAELWAATMRHGIPYHRITDRRPGLASNPPVTVLEMACHRHTVEGRGVHPTGDDITKHAMVPCVRCYGITS